MTETIHWVLEVQINEGQLQEFKTVMTQMIAISERESGTLIYEWYLDDDQSLCTINERFRDSTSASIHLEGFSLSAEQFLNTVKPVRFTVFGNPSPAVREGLGALNPTFLNFEAGFSRSL